MPVARTSHLHRLTTIGLAALFVIIGSLGVAGPAAAHDALVPEASDPVPGSTIEAMPAEIALAFSSELLTMGPADTIVEVLSPSGEVVSAGDAEVNGALVTQAIGEATEAGTYTVNWHVVSSDGHPTEGTYTFSVTTAAAPAAEQTDPPAATEEPTATEEPAATATPAAAPDDEASAPDAWPWILLITAAIVVVAAVLPLVIRRGRDGRMNGPSGQS